MVITHDEKINMLEYSYSGTKNNKVINILEQEMLHKHISQDFNFIHLGLIQVAAKPNYRLGYTN